MKRKGFWIKSQACFHIFHLHWPRIQQIKLNYKLDFPFHLFFTYRFYKSVISNFKPQLTLIFKLKAPYTFENALAVSCSQAPAVDVF